VKQIGEPYRKFLPPGLHLAIGNHSARYDESVLSAEEAEEYERIGHPGRREEFLSTRGLIKQLAGEIGLEGRQFEVHKDGLGKPFGIYRENRYFLSLAHTDDRVLCGISEDIPIGIDIEPVDRDVSERLRERMVHPDERKALEKVPLIRIWTLKEAMVKLEGKGLRTNLNKIRVRPVDDHTFRGRFNDDKSARICSFQHDRHWLSVACYQ